MTGAMSGTRSHSFAWLALLFLSAFTDNPSRAETPDAAPADGFVPLWRRPEPAPVLPKQMWLRGGLLFDRPGADRRPEAGANSNAQRKTGRGRVHGHRNEGVGRIVPDPVLVDVLEGGKLRAHLDRGRILEGWPAKSEFNGFVKRSELGLFAQVDTPLINPSTGETIGRVFAGTFVSVRDVKGDQAVLGNEELVGGFQVRLSSLGLARIAPPRKPESDAWMEAWGHDLILSLGEANPGKVYVGCAPARNLETKVVDGKLLHRLAVYANGIEIEGWASEKLKWDYDYLGCFRSLQTLPPYYPRILDRNGKEVSPPLPDGYLAPPAPNGNALYRRIEKWLASTPTIFLPYAEGWKITCRGLKVEARMLKELHPESGVASRSTSYYLYNDGWIVLDDWKVLDPEGKEIATSAWSDFRVVAIHENSLELVAAINIRGYHRDDTEFWYRTEQDCKDHATLGHTSIAFGFQP